VTHVWSAETVKFRMIEAMRIMSRLPESGRMKRLRTIWPDDTYAKDPAAIQLNDFVEQRVVLSELGEDELQERARHRLNRRPPPHPRQIARMEQSLRWPVSYLDSEDCRIMNRWAHEIATTGRSAQIAGELGISKQWLNKRILRISGIIARRLQVANVVPM